jgi:hypothetical protein
MRYLPVVLLCIGLVMVMGGGQKGVRAGGSIVLVLVGLIALFVLFAFVIKISS